MVVDGVVAVLGCWDVLDHYTLGMWGTHLYPCAAPSSYTMKRRYPYTAQLLLLMQ
jgi:hypothetical protein